MKQYMLSVHHVEGAPQPPAEQTEAAYGQVGRVNDEMQAAGAWVFGGGLHPADRATVVRVENGRTTTTDGPFAETREQLGGFWVIQCDDLDQALSWAEKCSAACLGPVEVRPFDDVPLD